jgi:hypothetical protein
MPQANRQGMKSETFKLAIDRSRSGSRQPVALICEAVTLAAYDELAYIFDLARDELLEFTIFSDTPIDVSLCSAANYHQWVESGYDPEIGHTVHVASEDVLAHSVRFRADQPGEFAVILMNWTDHPADLAIEIPDWL